MLISSCKNDRIVTGAKHNLFNSSRIRSICTMKVILLTEIPGCTLYTASIVGIQAWVSVFEMVFILLGGNMPFRTDKYEPLLYPAGLWKIEPAFSGEALICALEERQEKDFVLFIRSTTFRKNDWIVRCNNLIRIEFLVPKKETEKENLYYKTRTLIWQSVRFAVEIVGDLDF